jgi:hypothetical protein
VIKTYNELKEKYDNRIGNIGQIIESYNLGEGGAIYRWQVMFNENLYESDTINLDDEEIRPATEEEITLFKHERLLREL